MRIAILTFGSRGDVQPYVALGLGLKHAGHMVRVVTQRDCESLVREYGLDYGAVAGDVRVLMQSEVGQQAINTSPNPMRFGWNAMKLVQPFLRQMAIDCLAACEESDVLLCFAFFRPFGSIPSRNTASAEETTRLVVSALSFAKQRGILLAGWGGLQQSDLPDTVMMVESIPHSWLFPQMAAIVHHGGAGTIAASLRAGVPSLLIPFGMDQHFWAQRSMDLGVGPPPIPRDKLTASGLAQAILPWNP